MSGREVGESSDWYNVFQTWTLVSDARPRARLHGVVTRVGYSDSDGDLNVWVDPDPGSEELLADSMGRRSDGLSSDIDRNSNGRMELEIRNEAAKEVKIEDFLRPGARISAVGWWVEDHGHAPKVILEPGHVTVWVPKTELHPIICISVGALDSPRFTIFQAGDTTGRFDSALQSTDRPYVLPLVEEVGTIDLGAPSRSLCGVLEEHALVDLTGNPPKWASHLARTPDERLSRWHDWATRATATQVPGSVHLRITTLPYHWLVSPMYLGQFRRTEQDLLALSVTRSVAEGGLPGTRQLIWDIKATLSDPVISDVATASVPESPTPGLVQSLWAYEHDPEGEPHVLGNRALEGAGPHELAFQLRYGQGPNGALLATDWTLDVCASNRPAGWIPGRRTDGNQLGLRAWETRVFVQARTHFALRPSTVSVKTSEQPGTLPDVSGPGALPVHRYQVTMATHLMADASERFRRWRLLLVNDADGEPSAIPLGEEGPGVVIDAAGPSELRRLSSGVTAKRIDEDTLEIEFDRLGSNIHSGGGQQVVDGGNYSRVIVTAELGTDFGELCQARTDELYARPATMSVPSWRVLLEGIERHTVVLAELRRRQIPHGSPWPDPQQLGEWPPPGVEQGAMMFALRDLSAEERQPIDTLLRMYQGFKVSASDAVVALEAATRGMSLPALPPRDRLQGTEPVAAIPGQPRGPRLPPSPPFEVLPGTPQRGAPPAPRRPRVTPTRRDRGPR